MGCYIVPLIAAIAHYGLRKKIKGFDNVHQLWLNLLFLGGAVFGVVDHIWNKELFLIGENLVFDLMLGVLITVVIFIVWLGVVVLDKSKKSLLFNHQTVVRK